MRSPSANSLAMPIARIVETDRKTTSSGRGKTGQWILEYEREDRQRHDPLTGWVGSADTRTQVRLAFADRDSAIAYATRHGLDTSIVAAAPVKLKLQAYADNFR